MEAVVDASAAPVRQIAWVFGEEGGVVDEHVDPSESLGRLGDHRADGVRVGDVGLDGDVPVTFKTADDLLGAVAGAPVVHGHVVAESSEGGGRRGADASGGAGHEHAAGMRRHGESLTGAPGLRLRPRRVLRRPDSRTLAREGPGR